MYGLLVLLILNIIVFIHEYGHFITSKKLGIKPKIFGIGFWKTIWQHQGKDGIIYKINILPLGGYIQFEPDAFESKAFWKRFFSLFNGVLFNLILAFVVSLIYVLIQGYPLIFTNTPAPVYSNRLIALICYTWQSVINTFGIIFYGFGQLFAKPDINALVGPIQLIEQGAALLKYNLILSLPLLILLDVNILIINILPLPALDGGRILFLLFEAVFKKKIKYEEKIHFGGFVALMLLMVIVLGKDIYYLLI